MALENDRYIYRVTWSEQDNEYVGLCIEFPSLSWLAETPELSLKGIRKVVADVVRDMQENNEPVPDAIVCKRYSGKFMVSVPIEVLQNLAIQAAESGVSVNQFASSMLSQ